MRSSRRAELAGEDCNPLTQGDVSELAFVTGGHAQPQTCSSVGSPHFEVGQKFFEKTHGLVAAGGKLAVAMLVQLRESLQHPRCHELGEQGRAEIGNGLGLAQTRDRVFGGPNPANT